MTARDIAATLWYNYPHHYRFLNTYFFKCESDILLITKAGYAIDIEIKISRPDFKADFKKEKHQKFIDRSNGKKWTTVRNGERKGVYSGIQYRNNEYVANRFFFAAPAGLLTIEDIPNYAGFIEIPERGRKNIIKNAPYIHKNKVDKKRLFEKLYWNYNNSLHKQFQKSKLKGISTMDILNMFTSYLQFHGHLPKNSTMGVQSFLDQYSEEFPNPHKIIL